MIRYSYLWAEEHKRGREDRPCAVILVTVAEEGEPIVVTVLPISHTPPADPNLAVEIPALVKRRLKLDDERSWVVLTEANRFLWPGPDLRPATPGDSASIVHGPLPNRLFEQIRINFISAIKAKRATVVARGE